MYRTLLVDDVASLRGLYRVIFEMYADEFIVVGEAGDGLEAIEQARNLQPDLVLLDVSMPLYDGMETLLPLLEASPNSRVIMVSGFDGHRLRGMALRRGAIGYIEKGLKPAELVQTIRDLLLAHELDDATP